MHSLVLTPIYNYKWIIPNIPRGVHWALHRIKLHYKCKVTHNTGKELGYSSCSLNSKIVSRIKLNTLHYRAKKWQCQYPNRMKYYMVTKLLTQFHCNDVGHYDLVQGENWEKHQYPWLKKKRAHWFFLKEQIKRKSNLKTRNDCMLHVNAWMKIN